MARHNEVKVPTGEGWARLAQLAASEVPPAEVDGVWVFRTLRADTREWGTAILARIDGDRRRIYTARYIHTVKGKERGKYSAVVEEVGSGPVEALDELIRGVEKRADDEAPRPVSPLEWFQPVQVATDGPPDPR